MLPDFDSSGNIPEGVYLVTEEELIDRFVNTSPKRKWLGERLKDLLSTAKSTGQLKRVFLWGSFVTNKVSPNDLDVLIVVAEDFKIENLTTLARTLFDHSEAKIRFTADVFWIREQVGEEMLQLLLDTYQTTRELKRRGIVEVKIL